MKQMLSSTEMQELPSSIRTYVRGDQLAVVDFVDASVQIWDAGNAPTASELMAQAACLDLSGTESVISLTIETSNHCNLKCIYCYQDDRNTRPDMTADLASVVREVVVSRISARSDSPGLVVINLIGGEPLLNMSAVEIILEGIEREIDAPVLVHCDTNGTIPLARLAQAAPNLEVTVCLTLPDDHNKLRYSSGRDTTRRIISNLQSVSWGAGQRVVLGYNVHDGNLDKFEEFLDWVAPLKNRPVVAITTALIDNYPHNPHFVNTLSRRDYEVWEGGTAEPLLMSKGWPAGRSLGRSVGSACQGHERDSFKVYSDGAVTICDAMFRGESVLSITDMVTDPSRLSHSYEAKSVTPALLAECSDCPDLLFCGGRKWCYHGGCDRDSRIGHEAFTDAVMGMANFVPLSAVRSRLAGS